MPSYRSIYMLSQTIILPDISLFLKEGWIFRFIYALMPTTHLHPCSWKEFTFTSGLAFSLLLMNRETVTQGRLLLSINRVPGQLDWLASKLSLSWLSFLWPININSFVHISHSITLPPFLCMKVQEPWCSWWHFILISSVNANTWYPEKQLL